MLKNPALLLCFSALALLPACAKKKEATGPSSTIYTIPAENLNDAQRLAKNASVSCEGECSPSTGLLAIANPTNGGQCTASLIGEDLVVTNSHCVAEDIKAPGSSCRGRLWLHFAADASRPNYDSRLECEKVLYASPEDGAISSPDYAYLKLAKPSNRPTLRLSRAGFANEESYTLHKVNPSRLPGKISGTLGSTNCRAIYNSDIVTGFFHSQATVAMLSDCTVIQGNSGGPVLASDGSVRAVIFGFIQPDLLRRRITQLKSAKLKEGLAPLNLAANFACLRSPDDATGERLPRTCQNLTTFEEARRNETTAQSAAQMLEAFQLDTAFAMAQKYPGIDWTADITNTDQGMELRPVPYCVRPSALSQYLDKRISIDRRYTKLVNEYDRYTRKRPGLEWLSNGTDSMTLSASGSAFKARIASGFSEKSHPVVLCP